MKRQRAWCAYCATQYLDRCLAGQQGDFVSKLRSRPGNGAPSDQGAHLVTLHIVDLQHLHLDLSCQHIHPVTLSVSLRLSTRELIASLQSMTTLDALTIIAGKESWMGFCVLQARITPNDNSRRLLVFLHVLSLIGCQSALLRAPQHCASSVRHPLLHVTQHIHLVA
jgi:hypothetical protein